jgi:hypothetical protein
MLTSSHVRTKDHIITNENNVQSFVSDLGIHEFNQYIIRRVRPMHFGVLKHISEKIKNLFSYSTIGSLASKI